MNLPANVEERMTRLQSALTALDDHYQVTGYLGGGGMGDVYLATDTSLEGSRWAVKVLADDIAKDAVLVTRFITEASIEASLQHPNIVKVFRIAQEGGLHFLIMTYVDGEDLDARMQKTYQMDIPDTTRIMLQVTSALECAHDNGIVHRDLKPSNIRIDRYDTVIVMDFGIAKVRTDAASQGKTMLGDRLGTPLYMSPEQTAGRQVDGRSDLYSLCVILYEMLSGDNPFAAENQNPVATALRHQTHVPPPLSQVRPAVSEELSQIVDRLLAKDPAVRYQKASEVRQALSKLGSAGVTEIKTPRTGRPPTPRTLFKAGPATTVPQIMADAVPTRPLTEMQRQVLEAVDGRRTILDIQSFTGFSESEITSALQSLEGEMVRTGSLRPVSSEVRARPISAVRPGTGVRIGHSGETTARPSFTLAPIRESPPGIVSRIRNLPTTVLLGLSCVLFLAIVAVAAFLATAGGGALHFVLVDASPFASVTIRSEKGDIVKQEKTPFAIDLPAGQYTFEFTSDGGQTRSKPLILGRSSGPTTSIREEFWDMQRTIKLIESY